MGDISYRVTKVVGLTLIWDVLPSYPANPAKTGLGRTWQTEE